MMAIVYFRSKKGDFVKACREGAVAQVKQLLHDDSTDCLKIFNGLVVAFEKKNRYNYTIIRMSFNKSHYFLLQTCSESNS